MQPKEYDAVLGHVTSPTGAGVLGGLEGVKQRLQSPIVAQRVAAVLEAEKYGQAGLPCIIQALYDRETHVQKVAYLRLQASQEMQAQQALQAYSPYPLFECLSVLKGHTNGVTAVAISPNGQTLASGSRDGTIKVWDWVAAEAIDTFYSGSIVYTLTLSEDGQLLIMRGKDQTVKAWNLKTGQQIRPPVHPTRGIASVLTVDRHLISGSQNTIKIWNLQAGQEKSTLIGHTSLVTAIAVSDDRQFIVSGSEDKTVRVWGIP